MAKRPNLAKCPSRREREDAALQTLIKYYARKAESGSEPNDRRFDHRLQVCTRWMRPDELDALLRDGEDEG